MNIIQKIFCLLIITACLISQVPAQEIIQVVKEGNFDRVNSLLENNSDLVNSKDMLNCTPLHYASDRGNLEIVEILLKNGAAINEPDIYGRTPVLLAASNGFKEVFDLLLVNGADTEMKCYDGKNILHCAASGGNVNIVESLIGIGKSINGPDHYLRTPLHYAAESNSYVVAKFLVESGADVDSKDIWEMTPLFDATFNNNLEFIDLLLNNGADINSLNKNNTPPFLYAIQRGSYDAVKYSIEKGADLNVYNIWGENALSWAVAGGYSDMVEMIFGKAEDQNIMDLSNSNPFHRAVYLNRRNIAELLISKGMDINRKDMDGRTALHDVVISGNIEMINYLLEKNVNYNIKDNYEFTPLDYALKYHDTNIVKLLKTKGALSTYKIENVSVKSLLSSNLNEKEAIIWYLGHSGWAVKTKNNLLIFDYMPPRTTPDIQSLATGIINPDEIKDLNIYVFVTHAHSDHYYPGILELEKTAKNINYIFGWQVRDDPEYYYMNGPRAELNINGIEISTVNGNHNMIPEVAYLVKVDGIVIYHNGDYMGSNNLFKEDMKILSEKYDKVDLAFVFLGGGQTFEAIRSMKPIFTFPMHGFGREYMYRGFARTATKLNLPTKVICADKRGDRYIYSDNKLK